MSLVTYKRCVVPQFVSGLGVWRFPTPVEGTGAA